VRTVISGPLIISAAKQFPGNTGEQSQSKLIDDEHVFCI
jgi:hypothetical protein